MKDTKIINLFAGPGAGKSTTAAGLFYLMKVQHYDVELVTEYAKDLIWEGREDFLRNPDQLYIFSQQYRRVSRLVGKVEYAIVDSPLLQTLIYTPEDQLPFLNPLISDIWTKFNNINFVLERNQTTYEENGRVHSKHESILLDSQIKNFLHIYNVPYKCIAVGTDTVATILNEIEMRNT